MRRQGLPEGSNANLGKTFKLLLASEHCTRLCTSFIQVQNSLLKTLNLTKGKPQLFYFNLHVHENIL